MFGLTFWENWYVIGKEKGTEPQFRFVYYTGKTLQNRYEGAFVYARKPELPREAMPSIYKLAREAGLDPTRSCCIDNKCFTAPTDGVAQPPPFTPVASADVDMSLASAPPLAGSAAAAPPPLSPLRQAQVDLIELFEDPRPSGRALFAGQRQMYEVREYDANGYRVAASALKQ